mgnify:CR=1 FL=1
MCRCTLDKTNLLSKDDFDIRFISLTPSLCRGNVSHSVYVNPLIYNDKLDIPIYRYMSFEHLIMMLDKKVLFIPNRQRFSDLREKGETYKKSLEEYNHTLNVLPSYRWKKFMCTRKERYLQIWQQTVSCWTYDNHPKVGQRELDENYIMWQCHKEKPFVCRIRSSVKRLLDSIRELSNDILISDIEYVPILRYRMENTPSDIFKKPEEYTFEQEIRIVALHNSIEQCVSVFDVKIPIYPELLIDEITLSPYICPEEEIILSSRLKSRSKELKIKKSVLMEFK